MIVNEISINSVHKPEHEKYTLYPTICCFYAFFEKEIRHIFLHQVNLTLFKSEMTKVILLNNNMLYNYIQSVVYSLSFLLRQIQANYVREHVYPFAILL